MSSIRKVVWTEGLLLAPQHFQQWDNYWQHQLFLNQSKLMSFPWGVYFAQWDDSFLPQGLLKLKKCCVLLKNGQWVNFNATYDGPIELHLPQHSSQALNVYLHLPSTHAVSGIQGLPAQESVAWQATYEPIQDLHDNTRTREVLLAKPNIQLSIDDTLSEYITTIKLAELTYHAQQHAYHLTSSFIPPVLKLHSSQVLLTWLEHFNHKLQHYISILTQAKEKQRHLYGQFGYNDFIYFNLIKTLSCYLAQLKAVLQTAEYTPYQLYNLCVALLGELQGYLIGAFETYTIPCYNHDSLHTTFTELQHQIEQIIQAAIPGSTCDIPLSPIHDNQYESDYISHKALQNETFCLVIYHEDMTSEWIEAIQSQVKIAAPSQLLSLIHTFSSGIELKYLASPVKECHGRRYYHYFQLNKQSKDWPAIVAERKIALFVGQALTNFQFELIHFV